MFSGKSGVARLSIAVIVGLILVKVVVGIITGSLSVLAQAVDSFLDLFAVGVTFIAIRIAAKPADTEHPFGHGKVENFAAIIQAGLILLAGGSIIYSAVRRIIAGGTPEIPDAAIGAMVVSIVASILLSRHLLKVARREDSPALEGNARNIAADVYSAAGVLVGLVVLRLTGLNIIDPILALAVSLVIIWSAYKVMRESFSGLMDARLPEDEENTIKSVIAEYGNRIEGFSNLCTRKAGSQRYINFNLTMSGDASLEEVHDICDKIEHDIEAKLPNSTVTIHVEPKKEKRKR